MGVLAALQDVEKAGGQAGLVRHVILLYLEEMPPRLVALQEAVAQQAVAQIEEMAHSLVGSATQVGATQVAAMGADLQDHAGDLDRAAVLVEQLASESVRVRAALEAMLQEINST
jgi:HPt (histidine-containing phosphotransfer) domain-containing protein